MMRFIFIFLFLLWNELEASSILLHTRDAVVWHPEQIISGELSDMTAETVTVHHNQQTFLVSVTEDQQFSFQVTLRNVSSQIWIEVSDGEMLIVSDTLHYTLGYHPVPIIKPYATVSGDKATLYTTTLENPFQDSLQFLWQADAQNPAASEIQNSNDSIATVTIPDVPGEYFYDLLVVAGEDSTWYQTLLIREDEKVRAFDIDSAPPTWMDEAVIYQVTPYNFVENGTFADITAKLPELQMLGINTLWLQPISKPSQRGQGYDVVDYLAVNPAFGTPQELRQLIQEAKALGMRVLFDIVLNHTSIQHPYAQDRIANGENSPYYHYYQSQLDNKPYSSFYHLDENGFVYYFWEDLVNLNYQNEEVQRWMLEVCKYWVREFDIDGYRLDAIWGVNARKPSFAKRLRTELKSIKPDLLLLAEDKGSVPEVFELGFDAAYDWAPDTSWVSQWSWEYEYDEEESKTIFNFPEVNERGEMLRQALFHNGGNAHKKLYYLENNDLIRFIKTHQLQRTKMAAALLFALPGIPMLYNGQEVGFQGHPYGTREIFKRDRPIRYLDADKLFPYYQKLIEIHTQHPALRDTSMRELTVAPEGALVAFHRWRDGENIVVVVNMDSSSTEAHVDIRELIASTSPSKEYELKDLLAESAFKVETDTTHIKIPMEGYSVRWLILQEESEVTGAIEGSEQEHWRIYPNPSDGNITISLPNLSFHSLRIVNMEGATVFEENINARDSKKTFHVNLPSSPYLLRISNSSKTLSTKILIQ